MWWIWKWGISYEAREAELRAKLQTAEKEIARLREARSEIARLHTLLSGTDAPADGATETDA